MEKDAIATWTILVIFSVAALLALIFSCLAYAECSGNQPRAKLIRRDLVLRGDLIVDGETQLDGNVVMDDKLTVNGSTKLSKLFLDSYQLLNPQIVVATGPVALYSDKSYVRVDTNTGSVNLQLPLVSQVPGMVYFVSKSQLGQFSTVNLNVSGADLFCSTTCTLINPVYTLIANQPDQVMITNDSLNTWFASAHP